MHTTHSVLLHYNHQVKYWWWFFAPTFYALVFFTKSLHHVYYNTQLFAKKHISCAVFLLYSPSGGIPPFLSALKFSILQFEISSLMNWIFSQFETNWTFFPVQKSKYKSVIRCECPFWNSNLEWTLVSRSVLSSEWPVQCLTVTSTKPLTVRWTINFLSWNISLLNFPKGTWLGGWIFFLYLWT